ncbi:hypothetical protein H696_00069 [Fonticula alba]|uniref:SB domain-containing protein n=1 Tax=Fonticula alba TaxID=691883 RepID=A0A058ZEX7_FONAL|nr:hypothetical protein H696_00069 [Fonticula alba]KCV72473.1 hypothetical protein H696_00069 [Fonticula alba]|eukprot:XP_009492174.1 hypothetical protein H696_00069 [Fonticula alba]
MNPSYNMPPYGGHTMPTTPYPPMYGHPAGTSTMPSAQVPYAPAMPSAQPPYAAAPLPVQPPYAPAQPPAQSSYAPVQASAPDNKLKPEQASRLVRLYNYDILSNLERLLARFPHLGIQFKPNHQNEECCVIQGYILYRFRDRNYQAPVYVWLPKDFPKQRPAFYVVKNTEHWRAPVSFNPAAKFIERQGNLVIPHLQSWHESSPDLANLFVAFQNQINQTPPLFSTDSTIAPLESELGSAGGSASPHTTGHAGIPPYMQPPAPARQHSPQQQPAQSQPGSYSPGPSSPVHSPSGAFNSSNSALAPLTSTAVEESALDDITRASLVSAAVDSLLRGIVAREERASFREKHLKAEESQLKKNEKEICAAVEVYKTQLDTLPVIIGQLESERVALDQQIAPLETAPPLSVADIQPRSELEQQFLDLVSDQCALEDSMLVLRDQLGKGRIDLKTYIKCVRTLAREQFLNHVLLRQVHQQMAR